MKMLLVFALAGIFLYGCGSPNLTAESLRGRCWSSSDPNCFPLCDQYRDLVSQGKFAGKKDCRQACDDLHKRLAAENAINRCEPSNGQGMDLCNLFCNQNFGD